MNSIDKLAKLFSDRDNPSHINITIGEVISAAPIRIKYGENVILESKHIYIAHSLLNGYTVDFEDDNGTTIVTKEITIKNELASGDKVIMVPDNSFKHWFVIDKVVKL